MLTAQALGHFLFIMKESNCKKIYADYFKIQVKEGYHIHHIDFNPENNDIENLLLLPDDLHRRLHEVKNRYGALLEGQKNLFSNLKGKTSCGIMSRATHEIAMIYDEIETWVLIKEVERVGLNFSGPFNYNKFRRKS